ncbi:MAG: glycosyltransferase family 4 protein [Actinomycetes bacterium]
MPNVVHGGGSRGQRVIGVATKDPFDVRTFSGCSAHLFAAIESLGSPVTPIISRRLGVADVATGAVNPVSLLLHRGDSAHPKIRSSWYWSRRTSERFSKRFDLELSMIGGEGVILQVGSHVRASRSGYRSFCITDVTVAQAVSAGQFSVAGASDRVIAEAIEYQSEVFESCEKVFVFSQWAAQSVIDDYGYSSDRVVVVGAGGNLDSEVSRRVDPQRRYLLFIGIDWHRKGGRLMLDAFRDVRLAYPDVALRIVGCEPDIHEDGVEVVGFLNKNDPVDAARLLNLYAGATCLVLLSDFDPFPIVILEAASLGVPVVSTNEGSRPEMVVSGETGILANRNAAEIAAAIKTMLVDPASAEAMGQAAQRRALSRFTWPNVADRVLSEMGVTRN